MLTMATVLALPDNFDPEDLSDAYGNARRAASEYRMIAGVKQKLEQQLGAWERFGMPVPEDVGAWLEVQFKDLEWKMKGRMREIVAAWKGTRLEAYRNATVGIGDALFLILSLTPPLEGFQNPAKLWKYRGLSSDRATNRKYNPQIKAWCLFRLAEPCVKAAGAVDEDTGEVLRERSPFRDVYEARRQSRPDMLPAGECPHCDEAYAKRKATGKAGWDCHNMGGPHYKPAHARVDALGVTAKAILLDAWRVTHGLAPKYGSL